MKHLDKITEWLFLGIALWHAAIAVTVLTAMLYAAPEWDGETAGFLWDEAAKAALFGFIWSLVRENHRLRSGTSAAKAFIDGWRGGVAHERGISQDPA